MDLRAWLARCPLIAILRGIEPEGAESIGTALADSGIAIAEVPLNSPRPYESIVRLQSQCGKRLLIGAGTVMSPAQVTDVARAGGRLIVLPHADPAVVHAARAAGLFVIPGFATPTEAFAMLAAGADALKLFPAEGASPAVLKAMRAVLPGGTLVLPVGGIGPGTLAPWLRAGAAGFGVGSAIYRPGDSPASVRQRASALVAEARAATSPATAPSVSRTDERR